MAAAIEVKGGELFVAALLRARQPRLETPRVRQLDLALQPLEPFRHPLATRTLARLVRGRQPPRQLPLACRFGRVPGGRERRAEHEMRVAVGWVAANRLAQPVDR